MSNWTQPICEACWLARPTVITVNEDGAITVIKAVRLSVPETETCAFCGRITIFGAYVRSDPKTTPFPKYEMPD